MAAPKPKRGGSVYAEVGFTGLKRVGGFVQEEFLTDLKGLRAAKVYTEMTNNSAIVGALLFAIKEMISGVEWRVEPPDISEENDKGVQFVEECMHDMSASWHDTTQEILTMLEFGFAPMEIVYKRRTKDKSKHDDNRVGWRKLSLRAQDSIVEWDFDDHDGVIGMWQQTYRGNRAYLPIEKMLLFRTSVIKNNPEGRSVLRNAYRPWYFQKRIEEIEGIGVERDLAGLPVMTVPAHVMQAAAAGDADAKRTIDSYENLVKNVRRDQQEGVILPGDRDPITGQPIYTFSLLATGSRRQFDTNMIIERQSRHIVLTVLADFLLLGHQERGSFALGVSKVDLFLSAIKSMLKRMEDVFNTHLLPRLWRLNGEPDESMPQMKADMPQNVDLEALSAYLQTLAGIGMELLPDDDLDGFLRNAAGLPEKSEQSEAISQQERDAQLAERMAVTQGGVQSQLQREAARQNVGRQNAGATNRGRGKAGGGGARARSRGRP